MAELFKLRWDYPVYQTTAEPKSDSTAVKVARSALPREQALRAIANGDPRPMLVLRECARCNKTDDALLTPGHDNEKVLFLSRWFHLVRLPVDVVQPDHPFNALFPTNDAEHLFVAAVDGSSKIPLESQLSRLELGNAMSKVLEATYVKDPSSIYKDMHVLGDQLDELDIRMRALRSKKSDLMEARVLDKKKVAQAESDIEEVKKEIEQKVAALEKKSAIALKHKEAPSKAGS